MVETKSAVNYKTAFLNPFPFFLLILLLIMSLLFANNVSASDRDIFCTDEQIQNFEDMGYNNKSDVFYLLIDGKVNYVYSPADIYYDIPNSTFYVNSNLMTIGSIDSDGFRYVNGYENKINMYSYNNACVLRVNDGVSIKDKEDYYLTNNGIELINKFTACPNNSTISLTLCCLLLFVSELLAFIKTNYILLIIVTVSVISLCVSLFSKTKGGVR